MSEFKSGTVARVRWNGVPYTAIKGHPELWWGPGMGREPVSTKGLTDIRPLVVLDPEDYEQIRGLVQLSSYLEPEAMVRPLTEALQRGLRSLVKPPRIPEPGKYGVVMASLSGTTRSEWVSEGKNWVGLDNTFVAVWDDLIDPVLVREGL